MAVHTTVLKPALFKLKEKTKEIKDVSLDIKVITIATLKDYQH